MHMILSQNKVKYKMNTLNVTKLLTADRTDEINKFPKVVDPHFRGGPRTSIATEAVLLFELTARAAELCSMSH